MLECCKSLEWMQFVDSLFNWCCDSNFMQIIVTASCVESHSESDINSEANINSVCQTAAQMCKSCRDVLYC